MSDRPEIKLQATLDVDFHTPDGTRLWLTTLLPDPDCGEARHRLHVTAVAESEDAARQLLNLTLFRIRAGVLGGEVDTA